jgi:hypothetical protein
MINERDQFPFSIFKLTGSVENQYSYHSTLF